MNETNITARSKHLQFCKSRALEYVEYGDLEQAVASMISDLRKHSSLECDPCLSLLGMMQIERGASAVRRWIEGFN